MRVTLPEIMHGLSRLLEIYPRPKHLPENVDELGRIWHRELGDLDADVFRAGVSAYCKTDEAYFPKPGTIRKLGQAIGAPAQGGSGLAAEYAQWERTWWEAPLSKPLPCPVCGGTDSWSQQPPTPRRQVWHDADRHDAAGIPFTGPRAERLGGTAVVPEAAA